MALKQTSLFDFDEAQAKKKKPAAIAIEEVQINIVNEDPVEVNFSEPLAEPELPKKSPRGRKKLSEAAITADILQVPEDEVLFQKKYYAIGIVAEMFRVNISLLRFWEKEFDILKPKKNGKGDRHFRPEDIKNLQLIHHLLREKKYTIEGARDFLKKNKKADENFAVIEELKRMKLFLNELKLSL